MLKYSEEDFHVLEESVIDCNPVDMIKDIQQWMSETKSETVYNVLESVIDIIIDNTTLFEG